MKYQGSLDDDREYILNSINRLQQKVTEAHQAVRQSDSLEAKKFLMKTTEALAELSQAIYYHRNNNRVQTAVHLRKMEDLIES